MDKKEYYRNNADRLKELSRLNYEKKKNDPEYKERMRQYYREHKKQLKEKAHKRYQEHAEERREKARAYYWEHKEQIKAQIRQDRYHNDPAYRGCQKFSNYKRIDREKNVAPADPSDYPTQEEVNEMLLRPCVWCGESDWRKIGLDRKDNRYGHIRNNIQPCCRSCNSKKGKLSNEEFKQKIAEGRIKLKTVKTEGCDPTIPDL